MRMLKLCVSALLVFLLAACGSRPTQQYIPSATYPIPTTLPQPTATSAPANTVAPSPTATKPAPTVTNTPTHPVVPTLTATVAQPALSGLSANVYTDDRSTPGSLIISLFNAVNRHEYLRAYSYWQNPGTSLGTLEAFSNGYANTASVDLVFGQISGDAGAGQMYYTVPVIIKGTATNGQKANYAACYVLHLSQPGFQAAPPFSGMAIVRGKAQAVALGASDSTSLAAACGGADYPISSPIAFSIANLADITKNNFLDNRSGPVEVISSLENALNRKEYVRAYSYWQNPGTLPGPFDAYAAGFSDTDTITATFGAPTTDAGAGQIYGKVPVALKVRTVSATTQTWVGCYTLHLSQPGIQGTLPFAPLGIIDGKLKKVDNAVNTAPLLATACN